jgi:hypothetical protein
MRKMKTQNKQERARMDWHDSPSHLLFAARRWEKMKNEPFYWLGHQKVRGRYVLVAREIGKSGHSCDIVAERPVTCIDPIGVQQTFRVSALSHFGIDFNLKDLEQAIKDTYRNIMFDPEDQINAFSTGLDPHGRLREFIGKGNDWVLPVEFYQVRVNPKVNYLRGRK